MISPSAHAPMIPRNRPGGHYYESASMAQKMRVFIGTEPRTEIARKVLEQSIARRTDADVTFTPMIGRQWEYDASGLKLGTGFSLRRWMIPAACGFQGRAIYLDADQLVLTDLWDLWTYPDRYPRDGASVWCTYQPDKLSREPWPQTSVMVIDCGAAKEWGWRIDDVLTHLRNHGTADAYHDFMHAADGDGYWTKAPPVEVDAQWNSLDRYREGKTKLLHYTSEPNQPWYNPDHAHAHLWKMELQAAINAEKITVDEIKAAVDQWKPPEPGRRMTGLHPDYFVFTESYKSSRQQRKDYLRKFRAAGE